MGEQDVGLVVASKDAVDAAELLGQREGALGLGPVGQEAAGLPAQVAL